MRDYSLQVISHLDQFKGQELKPYFVEGIDTIGVWGDEPFELKFTNHTANTVQVRLSVDGTDVLTAEKAHVEPHGEMFVVQPYQSMNLEAWPETTEAGARFVFGKAGASVAAHTHGDMSNKGIIAAAVFVEGYVAPVRVQNSTYFHNKRKSMSYGGGSEGSRGISYPASAGSMQPESLCLNTDLNRLVDPAVGAGETIKQFIGTVSGLIQPRLDYTVRCRYVWYDDLKTKLEKFSTAQVHPSGFTNQPQQLANLKGTPRIERTRVQTTELTVG